MHVVNSKVNNLEVNNEDDNEDNLQWNNDNSELSDNGGRESWDATKHTKHQLDIRNATSCQTFSISHKTQAGIGAFDLSKAISVTPTFLIKILRT